MGIAMSSKLKIQIQYWGLFCSGIYKVFEISEKSRQSSL